MKSNATEPAPSDRSASEQAECERLRKQEINMYAQRRSIDRGREVTVPQIPRFANREEQDAWVAEKRRMDAELGRIQRENWRRRQEAEKASQVPRGQ